MADSGQEAYRRRSLERVTAFTDGTVAIALTLLVLPLVDIAQVSERQPVWQELARHSGDLLAFVVSFLVIAQFWGGHRRLFETLDDYDERLLWINTLWLLFVVFLPYPTARLFVESRVGVGSAELYLGTMVAVALLGVALAWYVARHPELRRADQPARPVREQVLPSLAVLCSFAIALLLALVSPPLGLLSLLTVNLVHRVVRRALLGRGSVT
jgi:TMEM175 potassium channel family protein